MAEIFISYAREDRTRVEPLAKALEGQGWNIWWDRDIPTGKLFNKMITEALANAQCVMVVWSSQSVNSSWVLEEAEEGRKRGILIPILIEEVSPPMGFRSIQTADLVDWDGTKTSPPFKNLVADIATVIEDETNTLEQKTPPPDTDAHLSKYRQKGKKKPPVQLMFGISIGVAAIIIATILFFVRLDSGSDKPSLPTHEATSPIPSPQTVSAQIYSHQLGFTKDDAEKLKLVLEENGIPSRIEMHRDPNPPDAIFIGAFVGAEAARIALSSVPYEIQAIFKPHYPEEEGGASSGMLIGIGYSSTHYKEFRGLASEPVKVSANTLKHLTEIGISNIEFQRRLREFTDYISPGVPTLEFVFSHSQKWSVKNIGESPAINISVAYTLHNQEKWWNPTQLYSMGSGEEVFLPWVDPNADYLMAVYQDGNNRSYAISADNDITNFVEVPNPLPWKESDVRPAWQR